MIVKEPEKDTEIVGSLRSKEITFTPEQAYKMSAFLRNDIYSNKELAAVRETSALLSKNSLMV